MEHGVVRDVIHPAVQFTGVGQLAEQEQVGDFEIGTVFGENVDGITAIAQDSLIAVNEGDRAAAGRGIHKGRVVGHQAEIFGASLDLAQIHRADGSVFDRKRVALSGAVVGDGYGILRHSNPPENESK